MNAAYAQYCEVVQLKEQKELELSQLRVHIDAQEADDDSMTNRLGCCFYSKAIVARDGVISNEMKGFLERKSVNDQDSFILL